MRWKMNCWKITGENFVHHVHNTYPLNPDITSGSNNYGNLLSEEKSKIISRL